VNFELRDCQKFLAAKLAFVLQILFPLMHEPHMLLQVVARAECFGAPGNKIY
jgi:hypothetical protein